MEGPFRHEAEVDLNNENSSHTQLILLTGRNKRVLEAGPATGCVTRVLKERGCSVTGIEIDDRAAAVAEPFCTRMIVGDVEKMDLLATFGEERFDVVTYGDVLEHLVNPDRVLENTRQILAPGGYVVASIPNVAHASLRLALLSGDFSYTDLGLLDRTHLRFYTRDTLDELFRSAGYTISDWKRIVVEPFVTEQGLREEDYPPFLTNAMREDEDALTYQYVVKASASQKGVTPGSQRESGHRGIGPAMSTTLKSLWTEHERTGAAERQATQLGMQVVNLERELNLIHGSIGYRMLEKARAPIRMLAPPGSPQRLPLIVARRALRALFRALRGSPG